ncbi:MAG: competence protein CoiA family protein [Bacillota bacterium]|nr:competence protein CoiA family protein [Bacillota bacterium]
MLVAKTKNGNMFCLGESFQKETLLTLRKQEEFFCPVCGGKVILKLGDRKIFHFSHLKDRNCSVYFENETEYHLEGKLKLYQWLRKQEIPAVLEFYDREIKQRPDILFQYNHQKYALEYQCSTISEEVFKQRTENYLTHGYRPLWILGGKQLKDQYSASAGITGFQYLFLRQSNNGKLYIPSFSPDRNSLQILYSIFPYSTKNALLRKSIFSLEKVKLSTLLDPSLGIMMNIEYWKKISENYKLSWSIYPSDQQREFFLEIYNHHLNLFLLPAEIGLPVTHGLIIQTPPFIWQTYYYIDLLHNKKPGDMISIDHMKWSFNTRIANKQIVLRTFPQIENMKPLLAFFEYSCLLVRLGVLVRKTPHLFQVQKPLTIPQTNREKEERTLEFFQKNPKIPFKE